jgi:hypothetical protein
VVIGLPEAVLKLNAAMMVDLIYRCKLVFGGDPVYQQTGILEVDFIEGY